MPHALHIEMGLAAAQNTQLYDFYLHPATGMLQCAEVRGVYIPAGYDHEAELISVARFIGLAIILLQP